MYRQLSFRVDQQEDLQDTTVMILVDSAHERWTLISTAAGEDLLVSPQGRIGQLDTEAQPGSLHGAIIQALSDWEYFDTATADTRPEL